MVERTQSERMELLLEKLLRLGRKSASNKLLSGLGRGGRLSEKGQKSTTLVM